MSTYMLIARRIGRIAFGVTLLLGLTYLVVAAVTRRWPPLDAAWIIAATWVAAVVAGTAARDAASALRLTWGPGGPGGPGALFATSLVVPTIGIALILPITLHLPFALALGGSRGFDEWVTISVWVTGPAHVVFAGTSAWRAYRLASGKQAWSSGTICTATVLTSCVPFIVLAGIPPLLVTLTALPCMPLLRAMERFADRERAEIAAVPQPLPRAHVVPAGHSPGASSRSDAA